MVALTIWTMDKYLFWNVRGLNGPNKHVAVGSFLRMNKCSLAGLIETKTTIERTQEIKQAICPSWEVVTNAMVGSRSRIWLIWDPNRVAVQIHQVHRQFIHARVTLVDMRKVFLTIVYGSNDHNESKELWDGICEINNTMEDTWLVGGDFNSYLHQGERIGGDEVSAGEIEDFSERVAQCYLQEVRCKGLTYTWSNKQDLIEYMPKLIVFCVMGWAYCIFLTLNMRSFQRECQTIIL